MTRLSIHYILLVAAATWSGTSATQQPFTSPATKLRQTDSLLSQPLLSFVDEIRKNGSIPGISIGVVRLGEVNEPIVQLASSGRKTEEGNGHDLTPDTLFGIASCSKAFLATSIGLLMEDYADGKNATPLPPGLKPFDWETKIADIVPKELGWALQDLDGDDWAAREASIADVLGHASGLPRHDYSYRPGDAPEDVIRRMGSLRTAFELRKKWSYNNQFFVLGAYLVSHYANMPYAEFVAQRLFKPLGMSTSTFSPTAANDSGLLTHTWTAFGRRIPFWFDESIAHLKAGPGGIISSAEDMVRWLSVLLNEGEDPTTNKTVIPKSVFDAVTTSQIIVAGKPVPSYGSSIVGYGMGWMRTSVGTADILLHNGGIPGFSTLVAFSPNSNLGIVILSNADDKASWNFQILGRILFEILGVLPATTNDMSAGVMGESTTPDTKPPSLKLADYAGLYSASGYLPIQLCSSTNQSAHCNEVISDFATIHNSSTLESTLYATYPTVWSTHVRLKHGSGDVFKITFTALFPNGYGENKSAFETSEAGLGEGTVEFEVRDGKVEGFSLVIDEDAAASRKRKIGGGLREAGDAWFTEDLSACTQGTIASDVCRL
ncbi:beta-lactamase/transpeptidase-like protein [Ganoderma leucocontextum]|nr:beta-lactamase/transpeptidase-like protein [Ganoderma leucocontextum]